MDLLSWGSASNGPCWWEQSSCLSTQRPHGLILCLRWLLGPGRSSPSLTQPRCRGGNELGKLWQLRAQCVSLDGVCHANRSTSPLLSPAETSQLPPPEWAFCSLWCQTSLGSDPDAGVLGAGCAGAPAVLRGCRQGLEIGVVDVIVLLAALLRKGTRMGNAVPRESFHK